MRSPETWHPSVFSYRHERWQTSLDTAEVAASSRVPVQLAARAYSTAIAQYARGDLIDLGCGKVPCYEMYRANVASITCIDWPASFHRNLHVDLAADLNAQLPLRDSCCDTVLLTDVLEHIVYPDQLWTEIARILRPGGLVIVGVPFMYRLHEQPHDYHRYTEFRLRRFCEDAGLELVALSATGDARAVARDVALKSIANRLPGWAIRLASRVALGTLGDYDGLPSMPMGYVLVAEQRSDDVDR